MSQFHAIQRTDIHGNPRWLWFSDALETIEAYTPAEVLPALRKLEKSQQQGLHAVGWIAYEASPAFDPHYQVHPLPANMPYLRFTVYAEQIEGLPPLECGGLPPPKQRKASFPLHDSTFGASSSPPGLKQASALQGLITDLVPELNLNQFCNAVTKIHQAIAKGLWAMGSGRGYGYGLWGQAVNCALL